MPIAIKYNARCELNIELFYKPDFLFFAKNAFKPYRYARFNQFGILLRYKLDTSPANSNNKRTDMFF